MGKGQEERSDKETVAGCIHNLPKQRPVILTKRQSPDSRQEWETLIPPDLITCPSPEKGFLCVAWTVLNLICRSGDGDLPASAAPAPTPYWDRRCVPPPPGTCTLFEIHLLLCVCTCMGVCVPWCVCGSQRATLTIWALEVGLRFTGLAASTLPPQSDLPGP